MQVRNVDIAILFGTRYQCMVSAYIRAAVVAISIQILLLAQLLTVSKIIASETSLLNKQPSSPINLSLRSSSQEEEKLLRSKMEQRKEAAKAAKAKSKKAKASSSVPAPATAKHATVRC